MRELKSYVDGVTILHVNGALTAEADHRALRERVGDLLNAGFKKILVDMAELKHLDGSGIGELLMVHAAVTSAGGEIKLLNLGKQRRDIAHLMILYEVFESFEDQTCALFSYHFADPLAPPVTDRPVVEESEFGWVNGQLRLVDHRN
jgi:anti-sigma B factor antagonist